jgi:hypothetical protein
MMKILTAAAIAFGTLTGISATAQANIVYTINQTSTTPIVPGEYSPLSDTVSGTITTDGTIGALQTGNILDYSLTLSDNIRPSLTVLLTPANSGIWFDTGNAFSASATGLSFDFSKAGAVFIIQGKTHGFGSGYQYFCFQATSGPCAAGETIVPDYYATDGVLASGLTGTVPLSAAPEPAAWAMMIGGIGGAGAMVRRRKSGSAQDMFATLA